MREYLARLLTARGFVVDAHGDGLAALDAARRQPPELVLTDVMMPGLDGFGLLAALRADPALGAVPVVLLSARAGQEATAEGLHRGADDYLVKPFSAAELLARVGTHVALGRLRREIADAARLRAAEMEAVLDTVPVGLWFTRDPAALVVHGNRAGGLLLRGPARANTFTQAPEAVPEAERLSHYAVLRDGVPVPVHDMPLQRAARGERVEADEIEVRFDDGTSLVLLCRALPFPSADGAPAGGFARSPTSPSRNGPSKCCGCRTGPCRRPPPARRATCSVCWS